jgi:hypothetical protein
VKNDNKKIIMTTILNKNNNISTTHLSTIQVTALDVIHQATASFGVCFFTKLTELCQLHRPQVA